MTIFATRRDPNDVRNTVAEGRAQWFGTIGGFDYCEVSGQEYLVYRQPADPSMYAHERGEITITRKRWAEDNGRRLEVGSAHHRALPVPTGTYRRLAAKVRKPAAEKQRRPWSVLAALPIMRRREPARLVSGPVESNIHVGALKARLGITEPGFVEVGGHEPPDLSPAGMIAYLAGHEVELRLGRGRLVALSPKPIRADDRELIERYEELLTAYLAGLLLPLCSMCSEVAVDVVFPRAPMCEQHRSAAQ